ncbi:MAG: radical SAM protein [Acidobacteriota bacterium]|nr:MAG: radical SAM protein [Acidobacteriota bacterium]
MKVAPLDRAKFRDPQRTATGALRASVHLRSLDTLWFNTGTLCNIECRNCYIESSPSNDRLAYLKAAEVERFLDEIASGGWPTREIGFTGGEPFVNPEIVPMLSAALERGFEVLVLTNAMRPVMRPEIREGLLAVRDKYADRLTLRVSLDHHTRANHERERGADSWASTLRGLHWFVEHGFRMCVAGRTCWSESEEAMRAGYQQLFDREKIAIDAFDPHALVLFPEMDERIDVPEITVDCWGLLNKSPDDVMCASSRMVVRRQGAAEPVVLSCTLIAYDPQFELGPTLAAADREVRLNHPHCAKFCVLGGASCSV